jgi:hypothetical protein
LPVAFADAAQHGRKRFLVAPHWED